MNLGVRSLSDAELVAIMIGTGTRNESAVQLSKRILSAVENKLYRLSRMSISELMRFKGIGQAKAVSIAAAMELGRRRRSEQVIHQEPIVTSTQIFEIFQPILGDLEHEELWAAFLNRSNKMIHKQLISVGGVHSTIVDPKIIFKLALEKLASMVVVVHNHPSGGVKPGEQDNSITKKLWQAGKLLDIHLVDHLIVTNSDYYSYADAKFFASQENKK